jgi:RecB family exonuclease
VAQPGGNAELVFLGWDRPFLRGAVEAWLELVARRGLDPSRGVLVLPGRRAARRVEELVAELAPPELAPPLVVTEAGLAGALAPEPLALAGPWDRSLAWRRAVEETPSEELAALWPAGGDELPVGALARTCARAFDSLAAEGLDAAEVARRAASAAALGDPSRWRALAAVEQRYRAQLARRGRIDPASAPVELARRGELREGAHVALLAVVDLPAGLRELLARVGTGLASFVFAPRELAEGFDELGALRPGFWAERDVELDAARWRAVDTPDEQARAALEHLARVSPGLAPEEVSIGVPDADVLPYLERRLLQAGCEPRFAGGTPLAATRPALLVSAALAWLAERGFEEYAALARHPDLELALARASGAAAGSLARALDDYACDHVPARVDGPWLADEGLRGSAARARALEELHGALLGLLGPLSGGGSRSPGAWALALGELVARVWPEDDLGARSGPDWTHARALERLAELCAELREAGGGLEAAQLGAGELLELFAERLEGERLPPAPPQGSRPVVELFGWLELVLDDAPELVLTGANEGSLPQPSRAEPLLFEAARRALGVGAEDRRVARDTWALSAILASRPRTLVLSGRRSSQRDPRVPSRLLFRCPPAQLAERVRRAWPESSAEPAPAPLGRARYVPPSVAAPVPTSMAVTSFRDYLASPYLFYVRHVLRLGTVDDRAQELDPRAFGTLAHAVLEDFGRSDLAGSCDEAAIAARLSEELDRLAERRYGGQARAAVRLQVEKLRRRLASFARWQARQSAEGWEIRHVEHAPDGVELDGMGLRGSIDRVDYHAGQRRWRVLDYKTGDAALPPARTHLRSKRWIDLQLPLYRYLAQGLAGDEPLAVGYVLLGRSESADPCCELALDEEGYASALELARAVIAKVRAGEFADVGREPPREPVLAALAGFGVAEAEPGEEPDDEEQAE